MKKKIFAALFMLTTVTAQTQMQNLTESYYLQKSKKQKSTAWWLLGGGTTVVAVGCWVGIVESFAIAFSSSNSRSASTVLFIAGGAAMVGSIPFFTESARNKQRALDVSTGFIMESVEVPSAFSLAKQPMPAIAFRIKL